MKISIKRILLLFITLFFLYLVFVNLDLKELVRILKDFDMKYLLIMPFVVVLSLTCRGFCFQQLISKTVHPTIKELSPLCITGAALNILLPARAGDLLRAFYIGQKYKVNKVKIFGSIMFERIFDVFIIFCFLLLGVFIYKKNEIAMHLCTMAGICMFVGIIAVIIAYKFNKLDTISNFLIEKTKNLSISNFIEKIVSFVNRTFSSFFNGFEVIESPKRVLLAVLASIGIWFFEGLNLFIVIHAFGYDIHWSIVLFIISFVAMACMIPSTSIFIGPYQFAVISAFSLYDIGKEAALAISFVGQAVITITTSIVAAVFLIKNNISYKDLKQEDK